MDMDWSTYHIKVHKTLKVKYGTALLKVFRMFVTYSRKCYDDNLKWIRNYCFLLSIDIKPKV